MLIWLTGWYIDILLKHAYTLSNIVWMGHWSEVELECQQVSFAWYSHIHLSSTYRENALFHNNDIQGQGLQVVGWALVMLKTSKADKVVVLEHFTLFSLLFHADVLDCQWMDMKCLLILHVNNRWFFHVWYYPILLCSMSSFRYLWVIQYPAKSSLFVKDHQVARHLWVFPGLCVREWKLDWQPRTKWSDMHQSLQ